jgi:hypothetical protein
MIMTQPTQRIVQPVQKDRWYRRAGRKVKKGIRKALLPTAFVLGVAGAGIGGFEAGRYYTAWQYGSGAEETLLEQKVEIEVTRKDGRIHYHKKSEIYKQIDPTALRRQLVDKKPGYDI